VFLDQALRHFGDAATADSSAGPAAKAEKLAELVARQRTLLVLDGVEPLQHPRKPGHEPGRFRDPGVGRLLQVLGQNRAFRGLCIVTTREPVVDLARLRGATVREYLLPQLNVKDAAKLLHAAGATSAGAKSGIDTDDKQLLSAARQVEGHALSLQLLGSYLKHAHGGDVLQRDQIDWTRAIGTEQEGHAFHVMQAYERWFEQHGDELVEVDAHPLVREYFAQQLTLTRSASEESGADGVDDPAATDSSLALRVSVVWQTAHGRLYEYLCESVKEEQPDSLQQLQPLYQAVAHGCLAGRQQEACDNVYVRRISRGAEGYSVHKLGAFGSELGVIASFFERPWSRVSSALTEYAQAWLLNETAFTLRALGRLIEALEPMRVVVERDVSQEDWKNAAISAGTLSELELTLGLVSAAVSDAEQSVAYADRSGDEFTRMANRTVLADALHQSGRRSAALALFREAESLQAARQPEYPLLYSLQGFRYCDLLLADAERAAWRVTLECGDTSPLSLSSDAEFRTDTLSPHEREGEKESGDESPHSKVRDVEQRATQTLQWADAAHQASLLTIALDHLTLSRANLYEALLSQSSIENQKSKIKNRKSPRLRRGRSPGRRHDGSSPARPSHPCLAPGALRRPGRCASRSGRSLGDRRAWPDAAVHGGRPPISRAAAWNYE
jgi:tetratricopeptide (TPR) repeat protein